jgi:hypothetical protein
MQTFTAMETGNSNYELLVGMGLHKSYASQIARRVRNPSLKLALRIFKETGLKFGPLAGASKADIAAAERMAERVA